MSTENLQTFCLDLLQAARHWRRLADVVARPHGLSESTALPLLLIAHRGGLKQNELADAVGVEAPSLVRTIDQLCAAGLVTRGVDGADRRVRRLKLTIKGRALADRLAADLNRLRTLVFDEVAEPDLAAGRRIFTRLSTFEVSAAEELAREDAGLSDRIAP